jgi:uncharacterized membrane protein YoaK (UPF0700 family)
MSRAGPALLAMAAACVDTCGFIGLSGLFTAHVTGNFVLIGAELVNRHVDILTKSLALPVFVASVLLAVATGRADASARLHAGALWPVVLAFAAGSALGFDCLWLACGLVAGAAWLAHRQASQEKRARSAI